MISFVLGTMFGGTVGVILISALVVGGRSDD